MTSPDGENWTARSAAGDDDSWYGVTYGNGLFVAVGDYGDRVMTGEEEENASLFTLPTESIASTTGIIGDLIGSISGFIWLLIGLPLAFGVIKKVMILIPK
jgi:hypothetical protein